MEDARSAMPSAIAESRLSALAGRHARAGVAKFSSRCARVHAFGMQMTPRASAHCRSNAATDHGRDRPMAPPRPPPV
jgi:hypothetical protein